MKKLFLYGVALFGFMPLFATPASAVEFTGAEVHEQYCDTDFLESEGVSEYVGYYGVNAVFTKPVDIGTDSVTFNVYPSTTLVNGVCKANTSQSVDLDSFRVTYATNFQAPLSSYTVQDFQLTSDKKFPQITIDGLDPNQAHYFITYYRADGTNQGGNISSYSPSTFRTLPEDGTFTFDGDEINWTGYTSGASLRVDLFDASKGATGWVIGAQMGTTGSYDGFALGYADRVDGYLGVSVVSGPDALINNERYYQWATPIVGIYKKDKVGEWKLQGYLDHTCYGETTGVDNECIGAALKTATTNNTISLDSDNDGQPDIAPVAASKVRKIKKKRLQIKAVDGAEYYKVIFRKKNKNGKVLFKFNNLKKTSKKIKKNQRKKLKGKVHITVKACNDVGCTTAATKTKKFKK